MVLLQLFYLRKLYFTPENTIIFIFLLLFNFLTDAPANFYIESRKNVRELSSIKTLIESTQNARQTFIFVNQVFLYSIKLNVGNKHIP